MSYNLVLNSKNLVPNTLNNNIFQYNFPQGSFTIPEGSEMAINQITIPYSFRNITSSYGNNIIGYIAPTTTTTFTSTNTISTAGILNDANGRIGAVLTLPNAKIANGTSSGSGYTISGALTLINADANITNGSVVNLNGTNFTITAVNSSTSFNVTPTTSVSQTATITGYTNAGTMTIATASGASLTIGSVVTLNSTAFTITSLGTGGVGTYSVTPTTTQQFTTQTGTATASSSGLLTIVTSTGVGTQLQIGSIVTISGNNYTITSVVSGSGGVGTYQTNNNTAVASATAFTSISPYSASSVVIPYSYSATLESLTYSTSNFVYITGGSSGAWTTNITPSGIITLGASAVSTGNYYQLTLPDGFYQVSDINNALQAFMKTNNHYWYSNVGSYSTQFQFVGSTIIGSGSAGAWTTTLTISNSNSPQVQLIIGTSLTGLGLPSGTYVSAQLTAYTYTIVAVSTANPFASAITSEPMYGSQGSEITPTTIFPLTISTTTTLYTNSITSIVVPTASNIQNILGSGYNYPSGGDNQGTWNGTYPTSGNQLFQVVIPPTTSSTQTIGNLLGYYAPVYSTPFPTSQTSSALQVITNGNSLSAPTPFPPKGSIVNGVIVRCNLIFNSVSLYNDVLDTFPITSTYGSNINYLPISDNWIKLKEGKYSGFTITFNDDNFNPLVMLDPTCLIGLLIRFPEDSQYKIKNIVL